MTLPGHDYRKHEFYLIETPPLTVSFIVMHYDVMDVFTSLNMNKICLIYHCLIQSIHESMI